MTLTHVSPFPLLAEVFVILSGKMEVTEEVPVPEAAEAAQVRLHV